MAYSESKKHGNSYKDSHISGDMLLKYITSARCACTCKVISYPFVFYWKAKMARYEKLEN